MTVYAVRGSDGVVAWSRELPSGAGTPAVDANSVYVSMVCQHAMAFSRSTGAVRWEHHGNCGGGGDSTRRSTAGACTRSATTARSTTPPRAPGSARRASTATSAFGEGTAYVPWLGGIRAVDAAKLGEPLDRRRRRPQRRRGTAGRRRTRVTSAPRTGFVAALSRSDGGGGAQAPRGSRCSAPPGTWTAPTRAWEPAAATSWSRRPLPGRLRRRRRAAGAVCRHVGVGQRRRAGGLRAVADPSSRACGRRGGSLRRAARRADQRRRHGRRDRRRGRRPMAVRRTLATRGQRDDGPRRTLLPARTAHEEHAVSSGRRRPHERRRCRLCRAFGALPAAGPPRAALSRALHPPWPPRDPPGRSPRPLLPRSAPAGASRGTRRPHVSAACVPVSTPPPRPCAT